MVVQVGNNIQLSIASVTSKHSIIKLHSDNKILVSIKIERNYDINNFILLMNQTRFRWVHNQKCKLSVRSYSLHFERKLESSFVSVSKERKGKEDSQFFPLRGRRNIETIVKIQTNSFEVLGVLESVDKVPMRE